MLLSEKKLKEMYTKLAINEYCCIHIEIKLFDKQTLLIGIDSAFALLNQLITKIDSHLRKDEYICILPQNQLLSFWHVRQSDIIYNRILAIDNNITNHSFSFGVSYPELNDSFNDVLLYAQSAGNYSKGHDKHSTTCNTFDTTLYENTIQAYYITTHIEEALKQQELEIYLQPKVAVKNQKVQGAEALIRWFHDGKEVSLAKFMPLINGNGFIRSVDYFVFEQVGKFIIKCEKEKLPLFPISVNISNSSYLDAPFYLKEIDRIHKKLNFSKVYMQFEISESIVYNQRELTAFIKQLQLRGYRVAMDDFGSGSSSLALLPYLPFDEIKLDQSFFRYPLQEKNQLLVSTVLDMLKKLDFKVVCEGVESEEWMLFLKQESCTYIQGFYYYAPMPLVSYLSLLQRQVR